MLPTQHGTLISRLRKPTAKTFSQPSSPAGRLRPTDRAFCFGAFLGSNCIPGALAAANNEIRLRRASGVSIYRWRTRLATALGAAGAQRAAARGPAREGRPPHSCGSCTPSTSAPPSPDAQPDRFGQDLTLSEMEARLLRLAPTNEEAMRKLALRHGRPGPSGGRSVRPRPCHRTPNGCGMPNWPRDALRIARRNRAVGDAISKPGENTPFAFRLRPACHLAAAVFRRLRLSASILANSNLP